MLLLRQALVLLIGFALSSSALGHEGHPPPEATPATANEPGLSAMVLPNLEGPKPWSDKRILNDPRRFQMAIMTDRTGGHRPGVWMDAVRKLNLLRPEFVVSVGDLIEGYSEDEERVAKQWEEFLGFIDQLQMRFFFVAGNHDMTNPMMHKMWRERFGPEWYSFDYKGVHFLCLCTEDPVDHLGEEQLAFVKKDLSENADARWTLVFLHKPLWAYSERQIANEGEDRTNWTRLEAMLVDRPHTIFSGHVHHYVQFERNNQHYYSLGTTGGGSQLRGNKYGEFDHITWLTMEPSGPHVVNLRLDGILAPNVVTEKGITRFRKFLEKVTVEVAPILVDYEKGFSEGQLDVRLINDLGERVEMHGTIDGLPLRGLTVDPQEILLAVGPTGSAQQSVKLRFDQLIEFTNLRRATFTAKIKTTGPGPNGEATISAEREIPIIIDRRYACSHLAESPKIDGVIEAWPERSYSPPRQPVLLGRIEAWQGPADGCFKIAAANDGEQVIFSVRVTDERVIAGDRMELILDARPAWVRRDNPRLGNAAVRISATALDALGNLVAQAISGKKAKPIDGFQAAGRLTAQGYDLEFAIPFRRFKELQGKRWNGFQLAAIQTDVDEPSGPITEILWRGTQQVRKNNSNYAQFVREN